MAHTAYESKLRSVVRTSMRPCPGNWVVIWSIMYHARAAHAFSAELKCRHCMIGGRQQLYKYIHSVSVLVPVRGPGDSLEPMGGENVYYDIIVIFHRAGSWFTEGQLGPEILILVIFTSSWE